ncbi:uncharacterized protein LOC113291345 [Papaver somniferum]|uniref:uncharacterized protein LOC113291345 n=1 Tax=Papaver somniferum TaxID=3469 RepID=UPI000E6F65C5|nr:uncharacterized protein LOC113291345 [Papaver somniferum]
MVLSGSMYDSDNSIWDSDESLTSDCDSENSSTYTKRLLDMDEVVEGELQSSRSSIETITPIIFTAATMDNKRPHGGSTFGRRTIVRDRRRRHNLIIRDYFRGEDSKYPPQHFRRRFRMDISLFIRILHDITNYDKYFTQRYDAVKREGLSPLQKMIAAVRMLAYGLLADILDEYIQIGESTAVECLKRFCDAIIGIYEKEYLRKPNENDIARFLKEAESRGFPGMIGSLDCMHWHWENFPTAWHGTHTNGFKRVPTLILEAVASQNLWIWHAFFGMAGKKYNMGYYMSDGIYPKYATLIQTISNPSNDREELFSKRQEAVRKDVERAFGVLQSRWRIVKGPARNWKAKDLGKIMKTCIILHNMIIENEEPQGIDPARWEPHVEERVMLVNLEHDHRFLVCRMMYRMKQV